MSMSAMWYWKTAAARQNDNVVSGDEAGRYEQAGQQIQSVDLEALDDPGAYESAMWIALEVGQFPAAAEHLTTLGKRIGVDVSTMAALQEMAPLVESPAYQHLRQQFPDLPPQP